MEAIEAIRIMARAGRKAEALEIVERAAEAAQAEYAQIQGDESRTTDYKSSELSRAYERRRTDLAEKLAKLADSATNDEHRDAQRVFGTAGLSGDPASLAISRRDASDRVSSVQTRGELRDLLKRANRAGDELLARAVAEKALDNLDNETLDAFLRDRPHLEAPVERLWKAARPDAQTGDLDVVLALSSVRPPRVVA